MWRLSKKALLLISFFSPPHLPLHLLASIVFAWMWHLMKMNARFQRQLSCQSEIVQKTLFLWGTRGFKMIMTMNLLLKISLAREKSLYNKPPPRSNMGMGWNQSKAGNCPDQKRCKFWRRLESWGVPNKLADWLLHACNFGSNCGKWRPSNHQKRAQDLHWVVAPHGYMLWLVKCQRFGFNPIPSLCQLSPSFPK